MPAVVATDWGANCWGANCGCRVPGPAGVAGGGPHGVAAMGVIGICSGVVLTGAC